MSRIFVDEMVMSIKLRIWWIRFATCTNLLHLCRGFCTNIFVLRNKIGAFKKTLAVWHSFVQKKIQTYLRL